MMITQSKLASQNVMRQYMQDRVPLDKRIEGVYIPTILTDDACFLIEYIKLIFKEQRIRSVGNILKRAKIITDKYRSRNLSVMHGPLFKLVKEYSSDFYETCIAKHLVIDQCTYAEELWKQCPFYKGSVATALGAVYFTRMVLKYIIQYERDWSAEVQTYLGSDIRYVAHDNETCINLLKCADDILEFYKAPKELDSYNILLSYKIFKNKVGLIDVTSVVHESKKQ